MAGGERQATVVQRERERRVYCLESPAAHLLLLLLLPLPVGVQQDQQAGRSGLETAQGAEHRDHGEHHEDAAEDRAAERELVEAQLAELGQHGRHDSHLNVDDPGMAMQHHDQRGQAVTANTGVDGDAPTKSE